MRRWRPAETHRQEIICIGQVQTLVSKARKIDTAPLPGRMCHRVVESASGRRTPPPSWRRLQPPAGGARILASFSASMLPPDTTRATRPEPPAPLMAATATAPAPSETIWVTGQEQPASAHDLLTP